MANINVVGYNLTTGRMQPIELGDIPTNIGGFPVSQNSLPETYASTTKILSAADCGGQTWDNIGTSTLVTFELPTAARGLRVRFYCADEDGIKVIAKDSATIRLSDNVTISNGYIRSVTIGSFVELEAISSISWVATTVPTGIWQMDSTTSAGFAYTPTAFKSFSPTTTFTTNTTWVGYYKQVGDTLTVFYGVTFTGATNVTALVVDLPPGFTHAAVGLWGERSLIASGGGYSGGVFYGALSAVVATSTSFTVHYNNGPSTTIAVLNSAPTTWGSSSGLQVTLELRVN